MADQDSSQQDSQLNDQLEGEGEEEYELNQEQIIQTILALGNEIWKNFGQTQALDDVRIFFQHTFYIQCFSMAYPDFDFSSLLEDEDESVEPEKMAEAIQALVDLLGQEILMYDMSHIRGDEIVNGNPEHCINLLQILQQISSASMMQEDDSEKQSPESAAAKAKEQSSRRKDKSHRSQEKEGSGNSKNYVGNVFGHGDGQDDDEIEESPNKQQFLDNLDDEDEEENHQVQGRAVGDVIGNISQELDIEFDHDIQGKLQNIENQSDHSDQSEDNKEADPEDHDQYGDEDQQHMIDPEDQYGDEDEDEQQMLDHNDVNIIDDEIDFQNQEENDEDLEDPEGRPLNRQTDNIGDFSNPDKMEQQMQHEMDNEGYGDEIINQEDSSNFNMDNQEEDDEGLDQLHDQLNNLDNEDDDERQIIDDQNLEMNLQEDSKNDMDDDDEDEGQHYPEEEEGDEDIMQLEEMEAQIQQQQMVNMQNQEDFDDIDPEILEAAQKLGLDDDGIRALQQQMYEQQNQELLEEEEEEEEEELEDHEQIDQEDQHHQDDSEAHQLAEMLNGDQQDDQNIFRGGQNISDDEQEEIDSQMADQLNQINQEDEIEDQGENEDEEQMIDIDNLNDNEKAILFQYLQDEYQKNPDQLPMPKDVIEQFLSDNQHLIQNMQMMQMQENEDEEGEGDEGEEEEDLEEEDVDHQFNDQLDINQGAMIIQDDNDINIDNIQRGSQNIDEEPEFNEDEEEDQDDQIQDHEQQEMLMQNDEQQIQEEDYEEDHQQINFNPQYQLEDIQERDNEGNLITQNLNVNTQNAQFNEQQYQMMVQQQQLAAQAQYNQQFAQQNQRVSSAKGGMSMSKKKRGSLAKKPPLAGNMMSNNKKSKRPNMKNINTISHDEENYNPNIGFQGMAGDSHFGRKNHSQKRPQTAKTKKPINMSLKNAPKSRVNNFMVSSTPSHKVKAGGKGFGPMMANTNGMVVPQSQMFTSFGVPNGRMPQSQYTSLSQRKALKKKSGIPTANIKKRLNPKNQQSSSIGTKSAKAKKNQLLQQQYQVQANQAEMHDMLMQNQNIPNNLVEMPILSEEFLNQLNEEQLQALLEQQQQLMMLQQQQTQPNEANGANQNNNNLEELQENTNEQDTDDNAGQDQNQEQSDMQQQMVDPAQAQQAMLLQQYQQQFGQPPQMDNNFVNQKNSLRNNRGRAKAYTQSGRQGGSANRIPSMVAGSGSRSHGSKKRTNKTRSSLNIKSSIPLSGNLGIGPQSLAILPNSLGGKSSKKIAAQIYGNSSMFQNLTSQRKKTNSLTNHSKKASKGGKRSQPNQGLKSKKFNEMQAQIQAQQMQYNMINDQQMQNNMLIQHQMQMQHNQLPEQFDEEDNFSNQNPNVDAEQIENVDEQQQQEENTEAIIDEASPEQEENESQNFQSNTNVNQISNIAEDLSTEQIIELLQNAQSQNNGEDMDGTNFDENGEPINPLPEEVQLQLQQVLQERMFQQQQQQQFLLQQQQMVNAQPGGMINVSQPGMNDRVQSYQNICNILTESVSKAKENLAHLAPGSAVSGKKSASNSPVRSQGNQFSMAEQAALKADDRILKQKRQFAALLKQYKTDKKIQMQKKLKNDQIQHKIQQRDDKIKAIKHKKFEEQMMNQQRSQMFKRNAQQVRMCKNVYKLASDLEKNKLLEEKKQYKENEHKKVNQKQQMVDTIENYYKDKITMLKDRIDNEKFERHIAQEAQKKALSQMKKELDGAKQIELQRYIQLLQQEDEKYDIQNMYLGRLESEIVKLYKKK